MPFSLKRKSYSYISQKHRRRFIREESELFSFISDEKDDTYVRSSISDSTPHNDGDDKISHVIAIIPHLILYLSK